MSLEHKLIHRAKKLQQVRAFFEHRGYLELDPPSLSSFAVPTLYIEPIQTTCRRYLHSSPEIEIKKILSQIKRDCYFLGHVFRHEEIGPLHTEEFTMIEYYKIQTDAKAFLDEVIELIQLFIIPKEIKILPYQSIFEALVPKGYQDNPEIQHLNRTEQRHWAWGVYVEKQLVDLTIVTDFPAEDASLAKINKAGHANRFEIYYKGIELANAFDELTDSKEQELRFKQENLDRQRQNMAALPYDPSFIKSLSAIPDNTYGIALGFDRLCKLSFESELVDTLG